MFSAAGGIIRRSIESEDCIAAAKCCANKRIAPVEAHGSEGYGSGGLVMGDGVAVRDYILPPEILDSAALLAASSGMKNGFRKLSVATLIPTTRPDMSHTGPPLQPG